MSAQKTTPAFRAAYEKLNDAQRMAVDTIEGPVMVIAGPGTGKTQILTLRIAQILLRTDTPPDAILALTFTESGVAAMRKRLVSLIGAAAYRVGIYTFHGFCNEVIRRYPEAFPRIIGGTALSDIEKIATIRRVIEGGTFAHLKPFGNDFHYVNEVRQRISELKRENVSPGALRRFLDERDAAFRSVEDLRHTSGAHEGKMKGAYITEQKRLERSREFHLVYEAYEAALRTMKRFDFEDMIVEVVSALERDEELRLVLQEEYQYVLADEHQDANGAQNTLLEMLTSFHARPNLFVVGDEKQAIFRFQGASLANFLHFSEKYPDAVTLTLTDNYRSGQPILDAAHALMQQGEDAGETRMLRKRLVARNGVSHARIAAHVFFGEREETAWVAEDVAAHIGSGVAPEEIAVLYRTNKEADTLVHALEARGVPVSVESDQNALEDPEIRKLLVFLRAVARAGDEEALGSVLHLPFLGIVPLDAYKLVRHARKTHALLADVMRTASARHAAKLEMPEVVGTVWELLERFARHEGSVPEVVGSVIRESGYLPYILSLPRAVELLEKVAGLTRDIEKLASGNPEYTLRALLDHLALLEEYRIPIMKEIRGTPRKGAVRLMTVHRSKGLEFDMVYVTRLVDGTWGGRTSRELFRFPTTGVRGEDDDERRLLFVAITRARVSAVLSYARTRDGAPLLPSRFLEEIDSALIERSEHHERLDPREVLERVRVVASPPLPDKSFLNELFMEQGLSVTALNNYRTCPWRYFYSNLIRIPMEQTPHVHYGNAAHRALKRFFDERAEGKGVGKKELLAHFADAVASLPLATKDLEDIGMRGREHLTGWYAVHEKTFTDSVRTEYRIDTTLGEAVEGVPSVLLRGDLDKIEFVGGSTVRVVDYKTGKPKSRNAIQGKTESDTGDYWRQLVFYKLLLEREGKFRFAEGMLDFLQPDARGKYHREVFEVQDGDVRALVGDIQRVAKEIWELAFWETRCGEAACHYCALRALLR